MTDHDSAGTAAELDELQKRLRACGVKCVDWKPSAYSYFPHSGGQTPIGLVAEFFNKAVKTSNEAADALASLRKQLAEARLQGAQEFGEGLCREGELLTEIDALHAANAKKDAALLKMREIAPIIASRFPETAAALPAVIDAALASQEAPASPKDVHIEHTLAASPSPGLRETGYREGWCDALTANADDIQRLREAVIEECAKFVIDWMDDAGFPQEDIEALNAAMRALFRPVSEREGGQ